jgi:hypothetical protein
VTVVEETIGPATSLRGRRRDESRDLSAGILESRKLFASSSHRCSRLLDNRTVTGLSDSKETTAPEVM